MKKVFILLLVTCCLLQNGQAISLLDKINLLDVNSQLGSIVNQNPELGNILPQAESIIENLNLDPNVLIDLNNNLKNLISQNDMGQLMDIINKLNLTQITNLENIDLNILANLNNQMNNLNSEEIIKQLTDLINSLNLPNLANLTNLNTEDAFKELLQLINGLNVTQNMNLNELIKQIPDVKLIDFILSLDEIKQVTSQIKAALANFTITENLASCLRDQLMNTTVLNPCMANETLLIAFLNQDGNISQNLAMLDTILNNDIKTGLEALTQQDFFQPLLNFSEVRNLTNCLIEQNGNLACLNALSQLNISLPINSSMVKMNLRQLLLMAIEQSNFQTNFESIFSNPVSKCLYNQLMNSNEINGCMLSILQGSENNTLTATISYILNTSLRSMALDLIKSFQTDDLINYYLNNLNDFENLLKNASYLTDMSVCLREKMSNLEELGECILRFPELKMVINPNSLRFLAGTAKNMDDWMRGLSVPLMTQMADYMKLQNFSETLEMIATRIEAVNVQTTTTTNTIVTTSSDSIMLKFSPILMSFFLILSF